MYAKITLLIVTILCFWFTPEKSKSLYLESLQAKEIGSSTGNLESWVAQKVQTWGKTDWKKETVEWNSKLISAWEWSWWTFECNANCKQKELVKLGIREEIAESLILNCKVLAQNPVNCIKIGAFLVKNESWWGFNCKKSNKYNCFWLSVKEDYKSYNDWVLHWVAKYNKYWFRQSNPNSFYSNKPWVVPITGYCKSELQPDWTTLPYCPNWHRHAWYIFNKLNF